MSPTKRPSGERPGGRPGRARAPGDGPAGKAKRSRAAATAPRAPASAAARAPSRGDRGPLSGPFDVVDALVIVLDTDGHIVSFNRACEELSGYTFAEVRGRLAWEFLLPPDEVELVRDRVRRAAAGESAVRGENHWRTRNGGSRLVVWSNVLLRGETGTAAHVVATGIDVTDLRATSERLRTSELGYGALLEQASDAIFVVDGAGRILDVNPRGCELLGFERGELLRMSVTDTTLAEDVATHPLRMVELLEGRTLVSERPVRRKDGTVFTAEISARGISDGRIVTIVRDVSERRRAEEALRESEARNRALFEHASDGIFIAETTRHGFVEMNPRACEMLGYTREELLRMRIPQVVAPEDLATQPVEIGGLSDGHSAHRMRRLVRKDGTVFIAEIGASMLPDGRVISIVRDVTERERVEEALRQSEARYRAVVEQASDGITITDSAWRFLDVNPRACELFGHPREQLLGMGVHDLAVPDDLRAQPLHVEQLARGETILTTRRIRHPDGQVRTVEISARGIPDGRTISVVRDVTERLRMERVLRESEERFRGVFESNMLGMVLGMQGGAIVAANDYFLRLVGYTRTDLLSGRLRWNVVIPPERGSLMAEAVRQAHEVGFSKPFESEFIRKDGSRVPVLCGAAFIGERHDFGVGFALDITERRLAEQRLAESERDLGRAQELAHVGTWAADLATMTATISEEMRRILGLPEGRTTMSFDELVGILHPEDRPWVVDAIQRQIAQGIPMSYEHRLARADGSVRIVDVSSEPVLDAAGGVTRVIGSDQDITERRFLEQQLREAQKLEAIGRLAGGVAHDFNNLLTVILGFTETMLDGLPQGDERRASAEQIRAAARRAAGLTQQLLAFGRRQVFRLQVFDLNAVLGEMKEILQRLIGEQIEIAISPGARQCHVRADRGQIEQVILNLALNARDAMPSGGRLSIVTRDADAPPADTAGGAAPRPGNWLLLTVSDTGVGMSDEVQAHIFEPFYTTKEVGQGTGLGLATVYGIVTQSGGRIEVSSAPGEGATFRVHLPCAGEGGEPEPAATAATQPGGEETILLVEDEGAVRGLVAEVLRRRGYQVIEAGDGDEAIEASDRHAGTIHLLVTDLVMPGMNGRELARFMEHARPGIRLLFVSGYSDDRVEPRAGRTDSGAFLQKPFTPVALARKVRDVLDSPATGPA